MALYLGIDTSNYTTSLALYDPASGLLKQEKMLLPVPDGGLGLRQSDAVFHHVRQLPVLARALFGGFDVKDIIGIGVSSRPTEQEGSYMPCFLPGLSTAEFLSSMLNIPCYPFSHQQGHIAAALFGAGFLEWSEKEFVAFHVSGGTTEALFVKPNPPVFTASTVAASLDLKAGQAVDRVGKMLGLPFPAGAALEKLAEQSGFSEYMKPVLRGGDCSLSGLENRCKALLDEGVAHKDIARFCLVSICKTIQAMTRWIIKEYGNIPLLYAGGVMSNRYIQTEIQKEFGGVFAPPAFCSDNAAGLAVLASRAGGVDR